MRQWKVSMVRIIALLECAAVTDEVGDCLLEPGLKVRIAVAFLKNVPCAQYCNVVQYLLFGSN